MKVTDLWGRYPAKAAQLALEAIAAGALGEKEFEAARKILMKGNTLVRNVIQTPLKEPLAIRSMAAPGVLVCTPTDNRKKHVVVDTENGTVKVIPTPEIATESLETFPIPIYDGKMVYSLYVDQGSDDYEEAPRRLIGINLLSGETRLSGPIPPAYRIDGFVPGMTSTLKVLQANGESSLLRFDPLSLDLVETIDMPPGGGFERYLLTDGKVIFLDGVMPLLGNMGAKGPERACALVLDGKTAGKVGRACVDLVNERLIGATVHGRYLTLAVAGGDFDEYLAGGRGAWYRLETVPLFSGGEGWLYETEGVLSGVPVAEGDFLVFPGYEGKIPPPETGTEEGKTFYRLPRGGIPLSKIALDRRTGDFLGSEGIPIPPWERSYSGKTVDMSLPSLFRNPLRNEFLFSPAGNRRLFPSRTDSIGQGGYIYGYREYWSYASGKTPVYVTPRPREDSYKIFEPRSMAGNLLMSYENCLFWKDLVFEPAGRGIILIKDFAGGEGMDRLYETREGRSARRGGRVSR